MQMNADEICLRSVFICFFARRDGFSDVGQVDNLRPIGNRPVNNSEFTTRRITNPPQVINLPHIDQNSLRRSRAVPPEA